MLTRLTFRRVLTGATIVSSVILGPIASINVEELAKKEGWDQKLVASWPDIMAVVETLDSTWAYAVFAFLLGATATAWVIRFIPEQAPVLPQNEQADPPGRKPARKEANGSWRQIGAITDDNPEGEWEYVPNKGSSSESVGLFQSWDGVDPLTMAQAAFLWAGEHPTDPRYLTGFGQARYITLSQAIDAGELRLSNDREALRRKRVGVGSSVSQPNLELARDELKRFIEERNLRPAPFLFPEDRY